MWSTAALIASTGSAQAIGGGFNPSTEPPVYPGSSRTVDTWKAIGTHGAPITEGASLTLVAPRWVIASEHAGVATSQTFQAPDGRTSRVLAYYEPSIPGVYKTNGDRGLKPAADISLSLLETPMTAPATGFPKLLEDAVSPAVADVLPGHVLWAGHGGFLFPKIPSVQWSYPSGLPIPGRAEVAQIPGDSGSPGLYFPTANADPLIVGLASYAGVQPPLGSGKHTNLNDPVGQTIQGDYATVKDWLKAMMARHPEAAPPAWTTLAQSGVRLADLPPLAPTNVRVAAAAPTAIAIAWDKPPASEAPRTGFEITVSPAPTTGKSIYTVGDVSSFTLLSGLALGTEYAFTVRAVGPNGKSPVRSTHTVRYRMRSNPSAVQDPRLTTSRSFEDGQILYCARLSWLPATPGAGTTITRYEVAFNGVTGSSAVTHLEPGVDGRLSASKCGYSAAQQVTATVRAISDLNKGPLASLSGPAAALETPQALAGYTLTPRRAIRSGRADYCIKATWTRPSSPDGTPLGGVNVTVIATDFSEVTGNATPLAPGTTSYEQCGLSPSTAYAVFAYQAYGDGSSTKSLDAFDLATTPTGAAAGTPIPAGTVGSATGVIGSAGGTPALCADVTWTAPTTTVDGFPVTGYQVVLVGGSPSVTKLSSTLPTDARSTRVCGLSVGSYTVHLFTKHAAGVVSSTKSVTIQP